MQTLSASSYMRGWLKAHRWRKTSVSEIKGQKSFRPTWFILRTNPQNDLRKQVIIFICPLRHIEQTHMEGLATVSHEMPHTTWAWTRSLRTSVQHRPLSYHSHIGKIKIYNSLFLKKHCVSKGFYLPVGLHLQGDECSGTSWGRRMLNVTAANQLLNYGTSLWRLRVRKSRCVRLSVALFALQVH